MLKSLARIAADSELTGKNRASAVELTIRGVFPLAEVNLALRVSDLLRRVGSVPREVNLSSDPLHSVIPSDTTYQVTLYVWPGCHTAPVLG